MKTKENKTIPMMPEALGHATIMEEVHEILNTAQQQKIDQYQALLDIKKAKAKKERSLRMLHLNIGMAISLTLVILAFNWKTYPAAVVELAELELEAEELLDVPISEHTPPPPPKELPKTFTLVEVDDEVMIEEIKIELDQNVTEDQQMEQFEYVEPEVEVVEEEVEEIFNIVEEGAEPIGGIQTFYQYIADNMVYPRQALKLGISGIVYVRFVVEKDGSLREPVVLKGIGAGCDEEAIRVVSNAPKWIPGKQRGNPVRVYKVVPIRFVFRENN